jgi:hypothetical protein
MNQIEEAEVVITDENFTEYFRDVRKSNPRPGEVMARFRIIGDLMNGVEKRMIVDQLINSKLGSDMAIKMLRNGLGCCDKDSLTIAAQICNDLMSGMTKEEVLEKPYKMTIERFFYTERKNIPDSPHWDVIKILNSRIVDKDGIEVDFNKLEFKE